MPKPVIHWYGFFLIFFTLFDMLQSMIEQYAFLFPGFYLQNALQRWFIGLLLFWLFFSLHDILQPEWFFGTLLALLIGFSLHGMLPVRFYFCCFSHICDFTICDCRLSFQWYLLLQYFFMVHTVKKFSYTMAVSFIGHFTSYLTDEPFLEDSWCVLRFWNLESEKKLHDWNGVCESVKVTGLPWSNRVASN